MQWRALVPDRFQTVVWRYAVFGAIVSVPITVVRSDFSAGEFDLWGVVIGAVLAAFLYGRGTEGGKRVGLRVGLLGELPFVGFYASFLQALGADILATSSPLIYRLLLVPFGVLAIVLFVGFSVVVGLLAGMFGGWAREQVRPTSGERPAAGG